MCYALSHHTSLWWTKAGATLIRLRCALRVGDGLRCFRTPSSSEWSLPSVSASDSLPQPPAAAERVLPLALAARGAARREGREGPVLGTSICTGSTFIMNTLTHGDVVTSVHILLHTLIFRRGVSRLFKKH